VSKINKLMLTGVTSMALIFAGCASSSQPAQTPSEGGSSSAASEPVTIDWWGWAPGYKEAAEAFNSSHDNIKLNFEQITSGSQGGYDKMMTAVDAGNAPCLGQVGSETFVNFLAQGKLEPITQYVKDDVKSQFPDAAWKTVSLNNEIYGIPVDSGTMGLFYRADLLKKYNIDVPTTWEEFKAAGEKLHKADPKKYLVNLPTDAYNYSGYAWQAGASWFSTEGDTWVVSMADDANKKVADYWQGLVDAGIASTFPSWDAALNSAWADGTVLTEVGAVWTAGILESEAKDSSGKWAVAPMPTWEGSDAVGNVGGSPNAVLKGCKNPEQAVEAAAWLSTNEAGLTPMIKEGALYPASTTGQELSIMKEGREFFGGQKIYEVFSAESAKVNPNWQWGPLMTTTSAALGDGLGKVSTKEGTVYDALKSAQEATIKEMNTQGYSVK
jgi:multiple sugar transport system substrate-binding protein